MLTKKRLAGVGAVALALAFSFGMLQVLAQAEEPKPGAAANGKEVTLKGRIVDLHCYFTGDMASADAAKCTADCIKAGVPAGLETPTGLVVLGEAKKSPAKDLVAHVAGEVSIEGTLYERSGLKYLDIKKVESSPGSPGTQASTGASGH